MIGRSNTQHCRTDQSRTMIVTVIVVKSFSSVISDAPVWLFLTYWKKHKLVTSDWTRENKTLEHICKYRMEI